jgi:hypothetical protein
MQPYEQIFFTKIKLPRYNLTCDAAQTPNARSITSTNRWLVKTFPPRYEIISLQSIDICLVFTYQQLRHPCVDQEVNLLEEQLQWVSYIP